MSKERGKKYINKLTKRNKFKTEVQQVINEGGDDLLEKLSTLTEEAEKVSLFDSVEEFIYGFPNLRKTNSSKSREADNSSDAEEPMSGFPNLKKTNSSKSREVSIEVDDDSYYGGGSSCGGSGGGCGCG